MDADLVERLEEDTKNAQTFSFDVARMNEDVGGKDILVAVIKTHLYLEHVILGALAEALRFPSAINLKRLSFPSKLNLLVALGTFPEFWKAPISKINEMRNRAAHELKAEIGLEAKKDLFACLPKFALATLVKEDEAPPTDAAQVQIGRLFSAVIVWSDMLRQKALVQKVGMRVAMLNAKRVITRVEKEMAAPKA